MAIYLPELDRFSLAFPSPQEALQEPNGLLTLGGDLKKERLLNAYYNGIFPWYGPEDPILWWSPTPRAIFVPSQFKPSKSLKKFYRKSGYKISINHCTEKVIQFCGELRPKEEMWLNPDMQRAYTELALADRCHSVEVWHNQQLVGGLYGVQVGAIFCGESMFSIKDNASKIALWAFCAHFSHHNGQLIDCQVLNPHTKSLGAIEISRIDFMEQLHHLRDNNVSALCFNKQWITIPSLEQCE